MAKWGFLRVLVFGQHLSDSPAGWGQKTEGTVISETGSPYRVLLLSLSVCLLSIIPSLSFPVNYMGDWRYIPSRVSVNTEGVIENYGLCKLSGNVLGLELILIKCWTEVCHAQLIPTLDISSILIIEVIKKMDIKKLSNTKVKDLIFSLKSQSKMAGE